MHNTRRICWGALFIALGILLPITFHMVGMGKVFLPMHIPILLAGFFCGPAIGAMVGFITPLLSAVMTGMPPFMPPMAQIMVFELAAYGLLTGLLFNRFRLGVYPSLLLAMLAGRAVHGLVGYLIMPVFGLEFSVLPLDLRPSLRFAGYYPAAGLCSRGYHPGGAQRGRPAER